MPTLKIDGQDVTAEKGRTIIQVCEQLGIDIPRYCYHAGLPVVGSCRMCMVEVEKAPKLQISCNTPVQDGMVVWTQTEKAKEARRSVLEFLLLNHPLDCPVCDQAGDCELQNYYLKFGAYKSRLHENKIKKKKATPIGPYVILDQERCVLCTRCVRFTDLISKSGELGVFNKGTWAEIDIYPGRELNNKYSGNVVDICPVGALLDRDYRFTVSAWYLKQANSICPGCSTGCNIQIHYNLDRTYKVQGRRIIRLKPRFNEAVNNFWMCDEGRYNYKWIDVNRIEEPRTGGKSIEWPIVLASVADSLKKTIDMNGPGSVAVIASPQMTNEELFLVRKIFFEYLKIPIIHFQIPPKPDASEDDLLLKKDKNPNTKGAELILSEQKTLPVEGVIDLAKSDTLKLILIFHTNLMEHFNAGDVRQALSLLDTVIYIGTNQNDTSEMSTHILAAASYAEKDGTFTNFQGRVQRIFPAVPPLKNSRPTLEILRDLGRLLGAEVASAQSAEVFNELRSRIPAFSKMDYASIGLSGQLAQENPESDVAAD
jgi:NADH-quinone oxidoreductase subunit G